MPSPKHEPLDLNPLLEAVEEWKKVNAEYAKARAEAYDDWSFDWAGHMLEELESAKKALHAALQDLVNTAVRNAIRSMKND